MAAEFHLAEYPLALHLLLQHPEGLVDIVVADENLHVVFLFKRLIGPTAKLLGPLACASIGESLPISTTAANWKTRGLRQVAVALRARKCLPLYMDNGLPGIKEQKERPAFVSGGRKSVQSIGRYSVVVYRADRLSLRALVDRH